MIVVAVRPLIPALPSLRQETLRETKVRQLYVASSMLARVMKRFSLYMPALSKKAGMMGQMGERMKARKLKNV